MLPPVIAAGFVSDRRLSLIPMLTKHECSALRPGIVSLPIACEEFPPLFERVVTIEVTFGIIGL